MALVERCQDELGKFWSARASTEQSNRCGILTFISLRHEGKNYIHSARLVLNADPEAPREKAFSCGSVAVHTFALAELGMTATEFVDAALSGEIGTPAGPLHFPPRQLGHEAYFYEFYHDEFYSANRARNILRIWGVSRLSSFGHAAG